MEVGKKMDDVKETLRDHERRGAGCQGQKSLSTE